MAKNSNTVVVKQQGKNKMYGDTQKLYFYTRYGINYLNHGGKCIMLDTRVHGKIKLECFKTYTEAKREFTNDFYRS